MAYILAGGGRRAAVASVVDLDFTGARAAVAALCIPVVALRSEHQSVSTYLLAGAIDERIALHTFAKVSGRVMFEVVEEVTGDT
jgi:hypothetical protein